MQRRAPKRNKIGRFLLTRIGDLEIYFRRFCGLSRVEKNKYFLEYPDEFDQNEIKRIVSLIRGEEYQPAIFIHGVLPRSGTNYLSDLMKRHKDVFSYTYHFFEFPLLSFTGEVKDLQSDFNRRIARYPGSLKAFEFSAYINAGMMKNLQALSESKKNMLFKYPFVHYLDLFRTFFPRDFLILILRDGRDVVSSSVRTFGTGFFKKNFSDYCREWDFATQCILKYCQGNSCSNPRTVVVKYEDLYKDPQTTIHKILHALHLDPKRFDFNGISHQPIRGSSALSNNKGRVTWEPQERQDDFNPIGRWGDWPIRQKRQFKTYAGRSLIAAGYAKDNNW